jgi:hypothetical protein
VSDRTVHAKYLDEEEIVRYDRAGKWYIELPGLGVRRRVGVREAAQRAREIEEFGGVIMRGRLGGAAFDRLVAASAPVREQQP